MDVLTKQQEAELAFWRGLVQFHGPRYGAYRMSEYVEKTRYFPSFKELPVADPVERHKTIGLDIGCGCLSVFEPGPHALYAVDALCDEYAQLLLEGDYARPFLPDHVFYWKVVNEQLVFKDDYFYWAACINMIDHTPNPDKLLNEIWRTMRNGATLFFEVNFEAGIAPPHYQVWDAQMVHDHVDRLFYRQHAFLQDVPEHNQKRFWAEYKKI